MYYPKSEITPNLQTVGNEFILVETGEYYKGPYYATSDGKFYTGADYSPSSQEITRPSGGKSQTTTSPTQYTPQPTATDYKNGFFIRYVIKRVNSGFETIKEVNESDFNAVQNNPLYNSVAFKWKLTGKLYDDLSNMNQPVYGIIHTNRRTLLAEEKKIPGISKFFTNLAQYSK